MLDYIIAAFLTLSKATAEAGRNIGSTALMNNPEFAGDVTAAMLLGLVAFIITCCIYALFQSCAWWSAYRASKKDISYTVVLKRFLKTHLLFWFPLFLLYNILDRFIAVSAVMEKRLRPDYSPTTVWVILDIIIVFFVCIALLHYVILALQEKRVIRTAFRVFFRKFFHLLPMYALITIVFFLAGLLLTVMKSYIPLLFWVIIVCIIFLPLFALARVFIIEYVERILK